MESAVTSCCFCFLLLSVFNCDGFHVLGPSGPLTVDLGDSVMLPCFVKTPLPMEELEVEWKRNDSGTLVHLWQDGESRPESQDQRYRERAYFFTEEIEQGNLSLFLTNITREDAGIYKCVVYTNLESDETLIEIKEIERFVVSGAHVISAYAGEDITLNCSVDSHIAPENIEQVSWKKIEKNIMVLFYEEGVVHTDSSDSSYRDRVELFSAEEIKKGNFSLRLKHVQTEDIGLFICEVFAEGFSANTTIEVRQLGLSSMYFGILGLCISAILLLFLSCPVYRSVKDNDHSRKALFRQSAFVFCPNIIMFIAFILWYKTEGSFDEAATCSALNFVRIFFLLWVADKLGRFYGMI
ncbi:butyrophilin-like protein 8 [Clarias gariepinus]|uniref:butyrophilin-like protein 8 n=1 Tax=Clarias gariepinus TaxID=13013 RepID=UPI00234CF349|nr:butyrophilin-like protein 8 [Clarias gariepinus]